MLYYLRKEVCADTVLKNNSAEHTALTGGTRTPIVFLINDLSDHLKMFLFLLIVK